jgi:hypothetical protein
MWSKLRTVGLVTLVTVLIWIWADAETQRDDLLHADGPRAAASDGAELVVDRLPVYVAQRADVAAAEPKVRLRAERSELTGVRIAGPAEAIKRIAAGEVTLYAVATVSDADYTPRQGPMVYGYAVKATVELCPSGLGLRIVDPSDASVLRVIVDKP